MKKINLAAVVILALSSLAGCDSSSRKIDSFQEFLKPGTPRVLKVNLSPDGNLEGPELRFFDDDGDGKTVERYIECRSATRGSYVSEIMIDLIRPGVDSSNSYESYNNCRKMTPDERVEIDRRYETFLGYFRSNLSRNGSQ